MSRLWSKSDAAYLAQHINTEPLHSIAEKLGRTVLSLRQKQHAMGLKKQRISPMRCAVVAVLQQHGPMSTTDIAEHLGWPREMVARAIACARQDHPGKFFRITKYDWQESGPGGPVPCYAAAAGKDAPKPRASKARMLEQKLASYYRHRASISARRTAKRVGAQHNPWRQLVNLRNRREGAAA